jgi:chromatin-remodeling ATPase INO80
MRVSPFFHLRIAPRSEHLLTDHTGEGHFADENKPSGTATPVEADARASKKRKGGSKKAKTTKQRLAIADGEMDM